MSLAYIPGTGRLSMKTWIGLVMLVGACGGDGAMMGGGGDDVIDPPMTLSALERCVVDGGSIKELWSVGNQHGPVTAIVAGSLVVLGGQDGSVKQWTVDGDEPSYGKPDEDGRGALAQGFLEASNVKLVDEMVNLMVAQRAYEASVKVVQASDEMLGMVNNLRK